MNKIEQWQPSVLSQSPLVKLSREEPTTYNVVQYNSANISQRCGYRITKWTRSSPPISFKAIAPDGNLNNSMLGHPNPKRKRQCNLNCDSSEALDSVMYQVHACKVTIGALLWNEECKREGDLGIPWGNKWVDGVSWSNEKALVVFCPLLVPSPHVSCTIMSFEWMYHTYVAKSHVVITAIIHSHYEKLERGHVRLWAKRDIDTELFHPGTAVISSTQQFVTNGGFLNMNNTPCPIMMIDQCLFCWRGKNTFWAWALAFLFRELLTIFVHGWLNRLELWCFFHERFSKEMVQLIMSRQTNEKKGLWKMATRNYTVYDLMFLHLNHLSLVMCQIPKIQIFFLIKSFLFVWLHKRWGKIIPFLNLNSFIHQR